MCSKDTSAMDETMPLTQTVYEHLWLESAALSNLNPIGCCSWLYLYKYTISFVICHLALQIISETIPNSFQLWQAIIYFLH